MLYVNVVQVGEMHRAQMQSAGHKIGTEEYAVCTIDSSSTTVDICRAKCACERACVYLYARDSESPTVLS